MVQAIPETVKKLRLKETRERKSYHCRYGFCWEVANVIATVQVIDPHVLGGLTDKEIGVCRPHAIKMSNEGRSETFRKMPPPRFTGVKK